MRWRTRSPGNVSFRVANRGECGSLGDPCLKLGTSTETTNPSALDTNTREFVRHPSRVYPSGRRAMILPIACLSRTMSAHAASTPETVRLSACDSLADDVGTTNTSTSISDMGNVFLSDAALAPDALATIRDPVLPPTTTRACVPPNSLTRSCSAAKNDRGTDPSPNSRACAPPGTVFAAGCVTFCAHLPVDPSVALSDPIDSSSTSPSPFSIPDAPGEDSTTASEPAATGGPRTCHLNLLSALLTPLPWLQDADRADATTSSTPARLGWELLPIGI